MKHSCNLAFLAESQSLDIVLSVPKPQPDHRERDTREHSVRGVLTRGPPKQRNAQLRFG